MFNRVNWLIFADIPDQHAASIKGEIGAQQPEH